MTAGWTARQRDRVLAVCTAVFAALYVNAARGIEDSLLSDAVGAGGVPQGVGIAMGLAAVALFVKSFLGKDKPAAAASAHGGGELPAVALRTVGLVLALIGYGLLLPLLGYPLSISLLVLAVGLLAGAALRLPMILTAAVAGPALWALFVRALQVRMPVGALWERLLG